VIDFNNVIFFGFPSLECGRLLPFSCILRLRTFFITMIRSNRVLAFPPLVPFQRRPFCHSCILAPIERFLRDSGWSKDVPALGFFFPFREALSSSCHDCRFPSCTLREASLTGCLPSPTCPRLIASAYEGFGLLAACLAGFFPWFLIASRSKVGIPGAQE